MTFYFKLTFTPLYNEHEMSKKVDILRLIEYHLAMEKIRELIKEKNMTIADAARDIGVSRQYLTDIINGRKCGCWTAYKIQDYFKGEVSANEIINDK